jgi:hypothetical protein
MARKSIGDKLSPVEIAELPEKFAVSEIIIYEDAEGKGSVQVRLVQRNGLAYTEAAG